MAEREKQEQKKKIEYEISFRLTEFQILLFIQFLANIQNAQTSLKYEMKLRDIEERRNKFKLKKQEFEKSLLGLDEKAKKEKEKEKEEKFKKKMEEMKKKREEENIKNKKNQNQKMILMTN